MRSFKIVLLALLLGLLITGCAPAVSGVYVPVETAVTNYEVEAGREEVFDAALIVAQRSNLNVAVLEKDSGLVRFEAASLSPAQLDRFCEYSAVHPETGEPWDTYENWNSRSLAAGAGPVRGSVSITLLITESEPYSNLNVRSNWTAYNSIESTACQSTGAFERDFINGIKEALAG